jgi:MFS family permease
MSEDAALVAPPLSPSLSTETPATRNPFTVANYRQWWFASVAAGLGVGIQAVTVPLFVRDRVSEDHRAIAIAAALICQNLPGALLTLVGGVIADRVERRRILVRTYFVAAVVSLSYVVLSGTDTRAIWPVFILAAIVGSAGAFTNPARQSMIPQMLARSQIQNGVIWGTMAFMASLQFLGPSLGGVVSDKASLTAAFACEVILLALGAILFWRIATDAPVPTGKSVGRDLVEGLGYIRTRPALLGLLLMGTVPGIFFMGSFTVTVVLIANDVLDKSDAYVGFLWGAFGLGIFAGSVLMTFRPLPHRGTLVILSVVFGPLGYVLYGLSEVAPLSLGILFVTGIVGPAVFINLASALLQENSSPQMMGRVMSMYGLSFVASVPLGNLQAGLITTFWGPQTAIVLGGLCASAIGVAALIFLKPLRDLK